MTEKQIALVLDGEAWIEYSGNLYEHEGREGGKHLFRNINNLLDGITVTEKALRHSTEIYYTEKF